MINVIRMRRPGVALLLIILLTSGITAVARAQSWSATSTPANDDLSSIHFPTSLVGYAVGDEGTAIKSTNGGASWSLLNTGFAGKLWYVRFLDASIGMAMGDNGAAVSTTDGGASWHAVNTGLHAGSLPSFLFGMQYVTPQLLFAVGGDGVFGGGVVIKSTDGGTTWTKKDIANTFFIDRCAFSSPAHGYIVGQAPAGNGVIYVTNDGGETWTLKQSASAVVTSVVAFDDQHAIALGSADVAYRTSDGGTSWSPVEMGSSADLLDMSFRDTKLGIAVGQPGTVVTTIDGGASWSSETIQDGGFLSGISFTPDGGRAFIAGAGGLVYSQSFAAGVANERSGADMRVMINPNPMRAAATLRLEAPPAADAYGVALYDMLGDEVMRRSIAAGGEITLDRGSLPSGRYLYIVTSRRGLRRSGMLAVE